MSFFSKKYLFEQSSRFILKLPKKRHYFRTSVLGMLNPYLLISIKEKRFSSSTYSFKYGIEGGIDSLRSPYGQPVLCALSLSNWLPPVVEPRRGFSSPPQACNMRKKSPHFHASSSLNMAVRGGLTRFARPTGSLFAALSVCPTGYRQLSNPGRGFSSPRRHAICEKKARISCELFFKYGGEGGIDSLLSPYGQPVRCALSLSNWLSPVVEPRSGVLIPPAGMQYAKKKPAFSCELFFKYGGEGGIRTPDTLPYTHFPGVLLQPLGHLTILFCCLTAWGQRGATIGSCANTVKQIFSFCACSVKH